MLTKTAIIKRLQNGNYRLYSRKKNPKTQKRRNLGTFESLSAAKKHEKDIQFFKSHTDDGCADDKITHVVGKMSDIANFLEEAGFIDSAKRLYTAMDALDGSMDNDEDCIVDPFINTDEQMNMGGGTGFVSSSPGQGGPSMSMDIAEKIASIANKLDKLGLYEEADKMDDILKKMSPEKDKMTKIIDKLDEIQENKKIEQTQVEKDEEKKQDENALARSTGRVGTGVTDNPNCGMGQGLSDSYFYHGSGSIESNI